jgi:hypothetical protein
MTFSGNDDCSTDDCHTRLPRLAPPMLSNENSGSTAARTEYHLELRASGLPQSLQGKIFGKKNERKQHSDLAESALFQRNEESMHQKYWAGISHVGIKGN